MKSVSVPTAVIVLVETSTSQLILTKRSPLLSRHPGEICFPGGRWEEGDVDLYQTGLRELREEMGIDSTRVHLMEKLALEKTLTGFAIQPWLAYVSTVEPFILDSMEVEQLVTLPLQDVLETKHYQRYEVALKGKRFVSLRYTESSELIWGATARIMHQMARHSRSALRKIFPTLVLGNSV